MVKRQRFSNYLINIMKGQNMASELSYYFTDYFSTFSLPCYDFFRTDKMQRYISLEINSRTLVNFDNIDWMVMRLKRTFKTK